MSTIKLAIYGALGYLVYQTFFAEKGMTEASGRRRSGGGMPQPGGRGAMTGGGKGRVEETSEPDGTQTRHRVGRGVI